MYLYVNQNVKKTRKSGPDVRLDSFPLPNSLR